MMQSPFDQTGSEILTRRRGFTLVELLVAIAIITVLLSIAAPAVQQARESARRTDCKSRLRQQLLAIHDFHAANNSLPPGHDGDSGRDHAWCTHILPYVGQPAAYQKYNFNYKWDTIGPGVENGTVAQLIIPVFLCPTAPRKSNGQVDFGGSYGSSLTGLTAGFGIGYGWEAGVMVPINVPCLGTPRTTPIRFADITDGTSQTIAIVEDSGRAASDSGQWANGSNCLAVDSSPNADRSNEIFSDHRGGAHIGMADGSVHFLGENIDLRLLGGLATRAHGEQVALP